MMVFAALRLRSGQAVVATLLSLTLRAAVGAADVPAPVEGDVVVRDFRFSFGETQTFGGELFGSGELLDATRYFIILPDGIGHGKSSKPGDGLHARFPKYTDDDMCGRSTRCWSTG